MRWLIALLAVPTAAAAAPASSADVVGIAVGGVHSCALHADGSVSCWGNNGSGQLGDGTKQERLTPTRVEGLDDAVEIAAEGPRTCARRRDGTVACWGELAPNDVVLRPTAVPVADVVQLAGDCMRTKTGAQCLSIHAQVVDIVGAADAIDIAGTAARGCIARKSGAVACWFSPNDLQTIPGVRGARAIAIESTMACALGAGGDVTCWTWAFEPPAPPTKHIRIRPPEPPRQLPVKPARIAITGARAIVSAPTRICARTARGVACWDSDRQIARVPGLGAVTAVAIGAHGCAVRGPRDVACWGPGSAGQLGFGWKDSHATPIAVPGITDAVDLVASYSPGTGGSQWTCARRRGGTTACWGNVSPHNTPGGDARPRDIPGSRRTTRIVRGMVAGLIDDTGTWSNLVADGGYRYKLPPLVDAQDDCAITADHRVLCAGEHRASSDFYNHPDRPDGEGIAVEGLTDAAQLAIGRDEVCARRTHGEVVCFRDQNKLAPVAGLDAIDLAAGDYVACAVRRDRKVACWSDHFQSPVLPAKSAQVPTDVPGLADITQIAVGEDHACARKSDGTAWCWGANEHGQLGDGTTKARHDPEQVPGLTGVLQIVAGTHHTCALLASGTVSCWGEATTGQIGSYMMENVATPVAVTW